MMEVVSGITGLLELYVVQSSSQIITTNKPSPTNSSWLPCGRFAMPLISRLIPAPLVSVSCVPPENTQDGLEYVLTL